MLRQPRMAGQLNLHGFIAFWTYRLPRRAGQLNLHGLIASCRYRQPKRTGQLNLQGFLTSWRNLHLCLRDPYLLFNSILNFLFIFLEIMLRMNLGMKLLCLSEQAFSSRCSPSVFYTRYLFHFYIHN